MCKWKGFAYRWLSILKHFTQLCFHPGTISMHAVSVTVLQSVLRRHFGVQIPHVYDMAKNVSFILQNGHYSVSYPRPYLPNVAEVACIHCREPKRLDSVRQLLISLPPAINFYCCSLWLCDSPAFFFSPNNSRFDMFIMFKLYASHNTTIHNTYENTNVTIFQ